MTASPQPASLDHLPPARAAALRYLLRLADNALVLGQRNAEWCGHGPVLEEDIALANISLDLIGQARLLYGHAGELEAGQRAVASQEVLQADVLESVAYRNIDPLPRAADTAEGLEVAMAVAAAALRNRYRSLQCVDDVGSTDRSRSA